MYVKSAERQFRQRLKRRSSYTRIGAKERTPNSA